MQAQQEVVVVVVVNGSAKTASPKPILRQDTKALFFFPLKPNLVCILPLFIIKNYYTNYTKPHQPKSKTPAFGFRITKKLAYLPVVILPTN